MAHMAANTVLVRNANSTGDPSAVAVTNTQILIGDGTGFTAAALSGDVSMTNAGAVAIVNDKVITAKILDANVTTAKLANDAVNADKLASNAVVNASVATGAAIVLTKIDTAVDLGGDITFGDQPDDTVIFSGHLQVDGDLLVSGDTTTLHTANLMVEDKFILLASSSGAPNVDGGIIVQTTNLKGTALGWDDSAKRWGVSGRDETSHDATSFAPKQYLTTVSQSTDGPVGVTVGDFGTSDALRAGMMHVETDTGEIYIFS